MIEGLFPNQGILESRGSEFSVKGRRRVGFCGSFFVV